jgi:EAL domain-containing protein (putative c-di-GMP-specific phosphodiesterase class I)/GGDEF domain-containing protein
MTPEPIRPPPTVLCAGGDDELRHALRDALAPAGWKVVETAGVAAALAAIQGARPDLVVCACALDGTAAFLDELAGPDGRAPIPWIAVGTTEQCAAAVAAGAHDWLVPPLAATLIVHRAKLALRAGSAERELVELRARAPADDSGDASAGLPPRERFLERADAMLRGARQRRDSAAMLAVSVEIGDGTDDAAALKACLPLLTKRLRDVLRSSDGLGAGAGSSAPVALLEGSEFTILIERQERTQEAYKVARRLQQELEKPIEIETRAYPVQVNVGIAVHLTDGANAAELYEAARGAMALARQEHGIRFATAEMNSSTFERLTLESNLRYALEREELVLYYQPRVDLVAGTIVGFEALMRWKHPELGMISPGQFIPIAEESGLIVPIGEWALREACRQNQAWRAAGLPETRMAVNLSSVQFRQPDLEVRIARVLEETGLAPDGLELELTESMLLQDADATIETLRTIREMGIHLSIDDFGTGYSSLSYIKRFPVDALKIDQSFVREVTTSPEDSAITTSIVLMGKSLGLTVVAEGVETRSQLEFLRVLECDEAQGYLFSRPVPAKEAGELLQAGFAALLAPSLTGSER